MITLWSPLFGSFCVIEKTFAFSVILVVKALRPSSSAVSGIKGCFFFLPAILHIVQCHLSSSGFVYSYCSVMEAVVWLFRHGIMCAVFLHFL